MLQLLPTGFFGKLGPGGTCALVEGVLEGRDPSIDR